MLTTCATATSLLSAALLYATANVTLSADAIGWVGLPSDPRVGCIEPPPFGKQCTLPRHRALQVCLATTACVAITCPSQEPYARGQPHKRIRGPICQLRSHGARTEAGHGMCKSSGCTNLVLGRLTPRSVHDHRQRKPQPPLREWAQAARAAGVALANSAALQFHTPPAAPRLHAPFVEGDDTARQLKLFPGALYAVRLTPRE